MAYGTPTDPVAGTVITVAYAVTNILDPIRALRAFTGGADPPGSNFWLRSTSTSAVSWVARATEVLAALGFTPVNKVGDTMTGALTINAGTHAGLNLGGNAGVGRSRLADAAGALAFLEAHNNVFAIYVQGLGSQMAQFTPTAATFPGSVSANSLSVAAAVISGAMNVGGTSTMGTINAGAISGTSVAIGGVSVLARSSHTGTQAPATISPQGAGSGLDADNLDANTWHAGLTDEDVAGVSPSSSFIDTGAAVTLDRAGTWLIIGHSIWTFTAVDGRGEMRLVVNGVAQTPLTYTGPVNADGKSTTTTLTTVAASVGHIAKIQVRFSAGAGIANIIPSRIVAIWLAP